MSTTNKNMTAEEAVTHLNEAFDCMEDYKVNGLESVSRVQNVKYSLKAREAGRLERKYGSGSPQAIKARAKISYADTAKTGLTEHRRKATVNTPPFEADSWRVQGRVVSPKYQGIPDLVIALYNDDGGWIRALGHHCTDENGFFVLTFKDKEGGKEAERYKEQPLILTVADNQQNILHREKEPVFLELGKIDSRLIVLGDDQCTPPPETVSNDNDQDTPDQRTPVKEDPKRNWTVKGTVRGADGKALKGMTVNLFDKEKQFENQLGTMTTNDKGAFEMTYSEAEFGELFKKNPKLYLRVTDPAGTTVYTSRKKIRCKTGGVELFKIRISRKR